MVRVLMVLLMLSACSKPASERVKEEQVDVIVSASGELESQQTAVIAPPAVSRMWQYQIKHMVPENSKVVKGDVIVSFDDKKVSERLTDKLAELNQATKELENKEIKEIEVEHELTLMVAEKKMEFEKAQRKAEIVDNSRSENDRKKAVIDFTIAENDLTLANKKLEFQLNSKVANLKLAKGKVERLTSEVNQFKRDISRLKVKAPIDGMVMYRSNWQGEKASVGESVNFGQPVMEIAVIEKMQLKAEIAEPDSGKVSIGQKVKVILDGTQELVVTGEIVALGKVFRDKSSQDRSRIFDAIIAFTDADVSQMRPGMTARVEVISQVYENALTLPIAMVNNEQGHFSVNLNGLFGSKTKVIEVVNIVGNKVVIKSGLSEGDEVTL